MKDDICFIRRSTDPSVPVFSSVVMARVAIDLNENKKKGTKHKNSPPPVGVESTMTAL